MRAMKTSENILQREILAGLEDIIIIMIMMYMQPSVY